MSYIIGKEMEKLTVQMKQSMSYYDLLAWLLENSDKISGCKIENVFKEEGLEGYILKLFCKVGEQMLVLEPSKAIYFTKYDKPKEQSTKLQLLRQLLRGLTIVRINIVGNERVVQILLSDSKNIFLELLPRGVLVITDPEGKILFTTETREMKDRTIKVGMKYTLPGKAPPLDEKELAKLIKKKAYARVLNAPTELIKYLNIELNDVSDIPKALEIISNYEKELLDKKIINPCYIPGEGFAPFIYSDKCIKTSSFNEAIDEYLYNLNREIQEKEILKKIEEEKERIKASIEKLEAEINKYKSDKETLEKIANYILTNSAKLEAEINKYKSGEAKFRRNAKGFVIISTEVGDIEIDPNISIPKNAGRYFELAKEYAQKIKKAEEAKQELLKKIDELLKNIEDRKASLMYSSRKKEWFERFRWSFTRNGYLIIGGKDASQNESLVKKYLKDDDLFLHADIQGGSVVILKNEKKMQISEEDIKDAALFAACYSRAWKVGLASIDVYWVKGEQVSKSPPSGEYLKKGSFMIYGKKNYLKNVELKMCIGIQRINESMRVIVGSEETVSKNSLAYVVLVPGDEKPDKLAKKIVEFFTKNLEIKGKDALLDEIKKVLPGNSRIVRTLINNFINQASTN